MSDKKENYIVLARKYRPKKLSDIIGQDETCSVIEGSFKLNRVAHAFLFSGTRGVGKTTLARILAKVLNCTALKNDNIEPCQKCPSCNSIEAESNVDVVEIDAASRTGVSDIREIIENINYKPVSAKKKIFIIDEVHMLSKAAFNALLKTLEEPPTDVVFIFATTETEKIPVTILSRCQRFNLKRVDTEKLTEHIKHIAIKEGYKIDDEASNLISQCSEGSVRDALSILDNVLAKNNSIDLTSVREVLGLADNKLTIELFENLFKGDVKLSLEQFDSLYKMGISIDQLAKLLMNLCYSAALIKSGFEIKNTFFDKNTIQKLKEIIEDYEMDFITRFWELLQKYLNELTQIFDEKQCFDMTIMRLCYSSILPTPFELLTKKSILDKSSPSITNKQNVDLSKNKKSEKIDNSTDRLNNDNLARDNLSSEDKTNLSNKLSQEDHFVKFSNIVKKIEEKSEIVVSYHLKNSFKLISFKSPDENSNVGAIELECVSKNIDSKQILWKASKIIEELTQKRWFLSISNKKGVKSLAEYEIEENQRNISLIKRKEILKKFLEIIPSSEVVSIEKIDLIENKMKKEK